VLTTPTALEHNAVEGLRYAFGYSMLPICYALSVLLLWGALDVGERKWYRGKDGIKRLLLHSLILGATFATVVSYLPMW